MLALPARDEVATVARVIDRAPSRICGRAVRTVVVDDGSRDGTAAAAREAGALVVPSAPPGGLGAAVATAFGVAVSLGAGVVAFCDADGEYDPAELGRLVGPIVAGEADYVVGNRFAGGAGDMRLHRRIGNRLLTRWVREVSRLPVGDGQSGFRALRTDLAARVGVAHAYNYAQVLTVGAALAGARYREVPVSYRRRRHGRSFVRLVPYLRTVVPAVHRLVAAGPAGLPGLEAGPARVA